MTVSTPIRLLLADDQALVRGALAALLALEPDLEVVAEVGRGDAVVAEARRTRPHVALLDVEMPGLDGISATAALRAALPSCRVLVVTTFGRLTRSSCRWRIWVPICRAMTARRTNFPTTSSGCG
jgi:two-component system, NarL family, response regulator DesR